MSLTKAVTNFSRYSGPALIPVGQTIATALASASTTFPALPISADGIQDLLDACAAALAKKASRATADIVAYNLARHNLEDALGRDGEYVNAVANGDAAIVAKSGYPSYSSERAARPAIPTAPTDVSLSHGDLPGEITVRYHPQFSGSMNEFQTTVVNPNEEAGWKYAGMRSTSKATLGGLTPGAVVWVRIRSAGKGADMSPWSDPAQIRVL